MNSRSEAGLAVLDATMLDEAELTPAISAYQELLDQTDPEDNPSLWAQTQVNLGICYGRLDHGDRTTNLNQSITHFKAAAAVYRPQENPGEWALTQFNLGKSTALLTTPQGDEESILEAISYFEAALTIFQQSVDPDNYAATHLELASLNAQLISHSSAIEQAIDHLGSALQVYSVDDSPEEWAHAKNLLGNCYYQREAGHRVENLKLAIECFECALGVYSEDAFPEEHSIVSENLRMVRLEHGN